MSTKYHHLVQKRRRLAKNDPEKLQNIIQQLIARNATNDITQQQQVESSTPSVQQTDVSNFKEDLPLDFLNWVPSSAHLKPKDGLENKRVVIVGGGFAGLCCARELLKCGVQNVVVLEARDRVGGRVHTLRSFIDGKWVEAGAELIGANHFAWRYYKEQYGLQFDDVEDSNDHEYTVDDEQVVDSVDAIAAQLDNLARKYVDLSDVFSDKNKWFDSQSLEDWIKGQQNEKIVGKYGSAVSTSDWDQFRAIMENNNGLPCSQQSLFFNMVVFKAGDRDGYSFWTDSELYRCHNGNSLLAESFQSDLGQDRVLTNTQVKNIDVSGSDVVITYERNGVTFTQIFDFCVLATPPSLWDSRIQTNVGQIPQGFIAVNPPPEKYFPQPVQMGTVVKFLTSVSNRFWEGQKEGSMEDYSWAQTWETTNKQGNQGNFCFTFFAGGTKAEAFIDQGESKLLTYTYNNLANVDPQDPNFAKAYALAFQKGRFVNWPNSGYTATGYSCPAVGEVTTLGKLLHEAYMDKMYFAGEHACHYWWSGFMEGALESGIMVARALMGYPEVGNFDHA